MRKLSAHARELATEVAARMSGCAQCGDPCPREWRLCVKCHRWHDLAVALEFVATLGVDEFRLRRALHYLAPRPRRFANGGDAEEIDSSCPRARGPIVVTKAGPMVPSEHSDFAGGRPGGSRPPRRADGPATPAQQHAFERAEADNKRAKAQRHVRHNDVVQGPLKDPPHSLGAEQAVLGALFLDNGSLERIAHILSVADFYNDTHRVLFSAIEALITEGRRADVVSLH
jgi:DnaB-like helicase N terminal domain